MAYCDNFGDMSAVLCSRSRYAVMSLSPVPNAVVLTKNGVNRLAIAVCLHAVCMELLLTFGNCRVMRYWTEVICDGGELDKVCVVPFVCVSTHKTCDSGNGHNVCRKCGKWMTSWMTSLQSCMLYVR